MDISSIWRNSIKYSWKRENSWLKKIILFVCIFLFIGLFIFISTDSQQESITFFVADGELSEPSIETSTSFDIKDVVKNFTVTKNSQTIGEAVVTERQFPNGDSLIFVDFHSPNQDNTFIVNVAESTEITKQTKVDTSIKELYPYRKDRKVVDPLSTTWNYIETKNMSLLIGTQVMYKDISYTYEKSNETSTVYQFLEELNAANMTEKGLKIGVHANKSRGSTWLMRSNEHLFNDQEELVNAHEIGVDEFRWITPNATLSHLPSSAFPSHPNAFVRSLVRQSGRSSTIALEKESTRFFENMNRHQFKSLEDARNKDGLWYSNYTSTWLERAYGFGPNYVDSRHNDNIFRSQLRRAEILGYEKYANNIEVYADYLIRMANQGYTIQTDNGYYLIDYYDTDSKTLTHTSLNHVLSLMNYLYYAYMETGNSEYLDAANLQLTALKDTGTDWINENGEVNYQLKLDGSFSGKDYNLVTYYDLMYTKKLLQQLDMPSVPIVEELITVKKNNLREQGLEFESNIDVIEDYVGLIE